MVLGITTSRRAGDADPRGRGLHVPRAHHALRAAAVLLLRGSPGDRRAVQHRHRGRQRARYRQLRLQLRPLLYRRRLPESSLASNQTQKYGKVNQASRVGAPAYLRIKEAGKPSPNAAQRCVKAQCCDHG